MSILRAAGTPSVTRRIFRASVSRTMLSPSPITATITASAGIADRSSRSVRSHFVAQELPGAAV